MTNSILDAKSIHFTGIKGVGMTAVALCAQDRGAQVAGSDVADHFVTDETLQKRNIVPKINFSPENIGQSTDFLVYTGAHQGPKNTEVIAAQKNHIPSVSLGVATGQLMAGKKGISVCGVGGKTTTTAMIATIFEAARKNPSYVIGAASVASLAFPGKYDSKGTHFIVEADEYATSPGVDHTPRFMHQSPETIVCTNISHDHPDIYPTIQDTRKAYTDFFAKLPENGQLIYNADDQNSIDLVKHLSINNISVGFAENCTYRITKVDPKDAELTITYVKNGQEHQVVLMIPGDYNAKNAVMATAVAEQYGIGIEVIKSSLLKFRGVNRRFQLMGTKGGAVFYDDYAHHPTEVNQTLKAAKDWFPSKKIIAIFQPHTYSRTKVLIEQFANSFTYADKVIITDIFPSARELPDPSINSQLLAEKTSQVHSDAAYVKQVDLVKYINQIIEPEDVLLTIGAGDVYAFHHAYFQNSTG